ncbi:MAG: TonB-dependent receptor plug domain-containing protein [Prolixibacteraceae bacterium]
MNSKMNIFLVTMIAVLLTSFASAQERTIQGVVTTFDSIPLIDAEVQNRSTKQTLLTDTLGRFLMPANEGDKIKIKAQGFYNEKAKVEEKTRYMAVNLKLKPGEKNVEYAIGYSKVSDRDKLNALAQLSNNDVDFSQYTNVFELIKGRFAGVQVANGEIIIRGVNSINSSSAALIVVDGVPVDGSMLSSISPVQVKSINVIKDGSSAIYGSRGANGVVIIETRRGGDDD